ncbi:hypothetical protein [Peribacillus muralis]|uniref:SunI/YnzG family protein n=1 Tax=Peribacillus muralis TaxID=264697 RepID=UPI003D028D21
MLGINIDKINENLILKWQLSTVTIPISEIVSITRDGTYAGEEKSAIRIGTPYATTDRILIKTTKEKYILFTTNITSVENKLTSYLKKRTYN